MLKTQNSRLKKLSENSSTFHIIHGGNLHEAVQYYGIPYENWIDLSTGINPIGYPIPYIPSDVWNRLPDDNDKLLVTYAAKYYHAPSIDHVLPVAGSQTAIRMLPSLLSRDVVGIAPITYSEYAPAFARHGHSIESLNIGENILQSNLRHVIVSNPNNPTTEYISTDCLLHWHSQISLRYGTLIIDEAFIDSNTMMNSLAPYTNRLGLIVLRSVGKFFGLAGIRVGFVLANPTLIARLRDILGMWTVSGPARYIAVTAFSDIEWQNATRVRLSVESERLFLILRNYGFKVRAIPLFSWIIDPRAKELHSALAKRGIWTRIFTKPSSIRIGLPANEYQWQHLISSLKSCIPIL